MYTYIPSLLDLSPTPTPPSHPSRSSQSTKLSSLCYTAGSHQLSILHMAVNIRESQSPNSSPSPYPQVHSLVSLCLYSRLNPRFFMTLFSFFLFFLFLIFFLFFLRFHIYVLAYGICFSLSDLLHSV